MSDQIPAIGRTGPMVLGLRWIRQGTEMSAFFARFLTLEDAKRAAHLQPDDRITHELPEGGISGQWYAHR